MAPNARKSRAETKIETRRRLLGAAREVFSKVGYQGATLDDIAAAAGFTKGALYWHFPNKQSLFMALVVDALEINLKFLAVLAPEDGDPAEVEQRMAEWIDRIDEGESLLQLGVELEIEARRDPSFREIHRAMIAKHEAAVADTLTRYFAKVGKDPVMPIPELATTLNNICKGFSLARQNHPGEPASLAKVARLLMGMSVE